jgi:hypothetical protein
VIVNASETRMGDIMVISLSVSETRTSETHKIVILIFLLENDFDEKRDLTQCIQNIRIAFNC